MRSRPVRPDAGFTLVELMIALVLSVLVTGIVFQLLFGQGEFTRRSGARGEVQQNGRMALELISAELRSTTPEGILEADRNVVRFRQARTWGLLCQALNATSGTVVVWARFPDTRPGSTVKLPADFTPQRRDWGLGIAQGGSASPVYAQFASISSTTSANPCASLTAGGTATFDAGFSTLLGGVNAALVNAPLGARVVLFQEVGYRASGGWVQRLTGYNTSAQPVWQDMAGPVTATNGVQFRYFTAAGTELNTVPLSAADRQQVASIRVVVRSESTARSNGVPSLQDSATTVVALRNRN